MVDGQDTPVVGIHQLQFRWPGNAGACLDIPELRLSRGESAMLCGPSGSGKSTLLGLLGGVLLPGQGSVSVLGADFARMSPGQRDRHRADHIGMLFQQFNLLPCLSVLRNVLLPCGFSARRRERAASAGIPPADEARRLLARLDIGADLWSRDVNRLSVGQQQRVAIARALIGKPELIIADEPTSALDEARRDSFLALLRQECAAVNSTLLFASHDQRLRGHFDRVIDLAALNRAGPAGVSACAS